MNKKYGCEMHHSNKQKCCGNELHKRCNNVLRWDGESNDVHEF